VVFFASCDAAEASGFRPCRRCLPRQKNEPAVELANQARALIEAAETPLTLSELGSRLAVSPFHLQRTFKSVTGLTPRQYAAAHRARQFKAQVRDQQNVTTALYAAGYNASSRLYESAPGYLGMTPAAYREGGNGMKIAYTIVDGPPGRLLVAGTDHGICAVSLADTDAELLEALAAEFPAAECVPSQSSALAGWAAAIRAYLSGMHPSLELPLDVIGTAFQHQVWAELRKIPYGETRTYTQVAQAIGRPQAVRAVARACATNPAALVIPCHRVVRSDGSHGGYRWGISRKEFLLGMEKEGPGG
jgi:AraC family transcriptional regulator of adaptative response/methylated-DNA-[protein]-cysteine methyltransferase